MPVNLETGKVDAVIGTELTTFYFPQITEYQVCHVPLPVTLEVPDRGHACFRNFVNPHVMQVENNGEVIKVTGFTDSKVRIVNTVSVVVRSRVREIRAPAGEVSHYGVQARGDHVP